MKTICFYYNLYIVGVILNIILGVLSENILKNSITEVFIGLIAILHCSNYGWIRLICFCSLMTADELEVLVSNRRVSFTNMVNLKLNSRGIYFMYSVKSRGEKQDLWTMPALIELDDDLLVHILMCNNLLYMKNVIRLVIWFWDTSEY